jgi:hypothetical protein
MKRIFKKSSKFAALALLALFGFASWAVPAAHAATLISEDDVLSLPIANIFINVPDGVPTQSNILCDGILCAPNTAVTLTEPGHPSVISDYVWLDGGNTVWAESELKGLFPGLPGGLIIVGSLVETGLPQDVGVFLDPNSPGQLFFSSSVPEPSIWAMLLLGFAGIGFTAYRRKQNGLAFRAV